MDEILIDEKKYVSSKRAAKLTGYAKDYVGQLCREGRVPARLVGRSWYVLESAIADHRFGDQKSDLEVATESEHVSPTSTWESPRYEASMPEILPPVSHPLETVREEPFAVEENQEIQPLQDSWKAWFDRTEEAEPLAFDTATPEKQEEYDEMPQVQEQSVEIEEEVSIPIRTVYDLPPEDLLPRHSARYVAPEPAHKDEYVHPEPRKKAQKRTGGILRTVQIAGVVFAVLAASAAVIGTGYFDEYVLTNNQIRMIAGVGVYNR